MTWEGSYYYVYLQCIDNTTSATKEVEDNTTSATEEMEDNTTSATEEVEHATTELAPTSPEPPTMELTDHTSGATESDYASGKTESKKATVILT